MGLESAIDTISKYGQSVKASGLSLLGGVITAYQNRRNRWEQRDQNAQDRDFQQRLYNQQHADAIADWNAQNAYNHPSEMMNRYRQAGLNPNLIYGNGAETTAGAIRGSSAPGGGLPAEKHHTGLGTETIANYYSLKQSQAQTDNLHQNVALSKAEEILKNATTAKTMQETARGGFELEQAKELKDMVIKQAKLNNDLTSVNIEKGISETLYTINKDEREALANSANIELTIQQILESKLRQAKNPEELKQLQIINANARKEGVLKQLDINLRKQGLNPNDPAYMRILIQQLEKLGIE